MTTRDYSDISPSAKSLLLLKGLTDIPFARQSAELISAPETYNPDTRNKDTAFWGRVVHFENRYWSVDALMRDISIQNILELSSGFSFRGLAMVSESKLHYIDTDLAAVIEQKKKLLSVFQKENKTAPGKLETIALDAMDEKAFMETVSRFPKGPIMIVNEGLLMYLGKEEKERLCSIIHKVLSIRGGYWITGDIYVKAILERLDEKSADDFKELTERLRINENMFDSFDDAAGFFEKAGFEIDGEMPEVEHSRLSSLKYLLANATIPQLKELKPGNKIQAAWRLKVKAV